MRIAFPDNPAFSPLIVRQQQAGEHTFIIVAQTQCEQLLRTGQAEIAFISPIDYATASPLSDYHIIGTTCLLAAGATNLAGIRFRQGLHTPRSYFAPAFDDFITTIGLLLLNEEYELYLEPAPSLEEADTVIAWNNAGSFAQHSAAFDLTEAWSLAFECALPLGIWVCRSEMSEECDLMSLTRNLAQGSLPKQQHLDTDGVLQWQWDDTAQEAFNETLHLLFYHRYIENIPAINVLT